MSINIGIVGTNYISDNFCEAALSSAGVSLRAVYSRKAMTGENFAAKYSIPHVYTDYGQFLNSDIDAVYIASPNYVHCQQTLSALNHEKHVLCEKVMAVNEYEVLQMIETARKNHVILLEAMRPDFDPAFTLIEKNLSQIGTLRRVAFEYCQYSGRYDSFRNGEILNAFNPQLSNAAIMDIGVYCIHSLVRFFGMPKEIKAISTKLHNGFEGSGIVLLQYENMTAEAVYSKISASVTPSVIQGEEGSLLIDHIGSPHNIELRLRKGCRDTLEGGRIEPLTYTPVKNNMVFEIKEFLRLIKTQDIKHKYLKYSLDTIRIIDEARRQNKILFPGETH